MRINYLYPIVYYIWRHSNQTEPVDIPRKSFKGKDLNNFQTGHLV
jgi:hypothetical protein